MMLLSFCLKIRFARFVSFQGFVSDARSHAFSMKFLVDVFLYTKGFNDNNFFVPCIKLAPFFFSFPVVCGPVAPLFHSVRDSCMQTLEK